MSFVCDVDGCGRAFHDRSNLVRHIRNKHPEITDPRAAASEIVSRTHERWLADHENDINLHCIVKKRMGNKPCRVLSLIPHTLSSESALGQFSPRVRALLRILDVDDNSPRSCSAQRLSTLLRTSPSTRASVLSIPENGTSVSMSIVLPPARSVPTHSRHDSLSASESPSPPRVGAVSSMSLPMLRMPQPQHAIFDMSALANMAESYSPDGSLCSTPEASPFGVGRHLPEQPSPAWIDSHFEQLVLEKWQSLSPSPEISNRRLDEVAVSAKVQQAIDHFLSLPNPTSSSAQNSTGLDQLSSRLVEKTNMLRSLI